MKLLSKIKENIMNTINVFRQIKLDNEYYKEYIDGMRKESQNMDSEFAKYDLKISDDGKFITFLVTLPEQFASATDYMIYEKLNETTFFITNYLKNNFGFGDYLSLPEYYHLEDPTNPNVASTSYLAQWTFQPMISFEMKNKYLSRLYITITTILLLVIASIVGYYIAF